MKLPHELVLHVTHKTARRNRIRLQAVSTSLNTSATSQGRQTSYVVNVEAKDQGMNFLSRKGGPKFSYHIQIFDKNAIASVLTI